MSGAHLDSSCCDRKMWSKFVFERGGRGGSPPSHAKYFELTLQLSINRDATLTRVGKPEII